MSSFPHSALHFPICAFGQQRLSDEDLQRAGRPAPLPWEGVLLAAACATGGSAACKPKGDQQPRHPEVRVVGPVAEHDSRAPRSELAWNVISVGPVQVRQRPIGSDRSGPRRFLRLQRPVCTPDWISDSTCPLRSVPRDDRRAEPSRLSQRGEDDVV
uniref:Uncharacterized protein n=1 Tax=Hyaloperonospora arabidopsidis (strain Emoy2) TaxID=559515 RepID=M4BRN1_HYAAE